MVPSSLKGKNRKTRTRKPMPIARRSRDAVEGARSRTRCLRAAAADECGRRALERGGASPPVRGSRQGRSLPDGATIYCLRHTAITRALLAGVPVRLVASSFDTRSR